MSSSTFTSLVAPHQLDYSTCCSDVNQGTKVNKPSSSRRQAGDTKLPPIESVAEIEQINGETIASNLNDECGKKTIAIQVN